MKMKIVQMVVVVLLLLVSVVAAYAENDHDRNDRKDNKVVATQVVAEVYDLSLTINRWSYLPLPKKNIPVTVRIGLNDHVLSVASRFSAKMEVFHQYTTSSGAVTANTLLITELSSSVINTSLSPVQYQDGAIDCSGNAANKQQWGVLTCEGFDFPEGTPTGQAGLLFGSYTDIGQNQNTLRFKAVGAYPGTVHLQVVMEYPNIQ